MSRGETRSPLDLPREVDRLAVQQATAEARQALEAVVVATHRALSYARQLDAALAGVDQSAGGAVLESGGQVLPVTNRLGRTEAALSPREQEVLSLVADGRSNKAIAAALFVSPNTVKTHVTSLLTKLRADSRVQLAAIATRQDLQTTHLDSPTWWKSPRPATGRLVRQTVAMPCLREDAVPGSEPGRPAQGMTRCKS